ncbi:MAG: hypothetical protein LWX56_12560 [Ignavibacteria bacterium]|nr:hypothetical protein [Ignavibacteria bacterium]
MKRLYVVVLLLCVSLPMFGQLSSTQQNKLAGGFGLNYIDGEAYYTFRFQPEFSFGKFGIGLDLNLDFGKDGLRKENFNEASDYLSIIRYIRYGQKHEPVYAQIGALSENTIGHGSIVYMYNNSPSFDARKIGLAFDIKMDRWGFETMYSDFAEPGLAAVRVYVLPFKFTSMSEVPIISGLEAGATFAKDFHDRANVIGVTQTGPGTYKYVESDNASVYGLDLGLPLIDGTAFRTELYTDYVKFVNYGSGVFAGLKFDINLLSQLKANLKMERRWTEDQFIPAYYGSLYEIERMKVSQSGGVVNVASKVQELAGIHSKQVGYFGSLKMDLANYITVFGSFQKLDTVQNSGILDLTAEANMGDAPYFARAGYSKAGIGDATSIFTVDDKTIAYAELGYKPYKYLLVSVVYTWTFAPVRDSNDNIIDYKAQKRIEPRVSLVYPL